MENNQAPSPPAQQPATAPRTGIAAHLAAGSKLGDAPGLAGPPAVPSKPFGGNTGRKQRLDGLKAGSPEALAADRAKDAERKRLAREAARAAVPPPTLPAAPPALDALENPQPPLAGLADGPAGDPVPDWTAEDFRGVSVELVELAEAWRVDAHTKHAASGHLPRPVVEEIAKGAAFPPGSKKSLANSSPASLAKMFNALKVPAAFKSVVTTAPALAYIIVRDLQTSARIEKLIAESKKGEEVKT